MHALPLALLLNALGPQSEAPAAPACALGERDRAWLERALEAWRIASREITGIGPVPSFRALFFDGTCLLTSEDALTSADGREVSWSAAAHDGSVALPDGARLPVGVTSFASGKEGLAWFVMSTPSVWQAAGVGSGAELERTMVGVLLHEASHVAQLGPYGKRLGALIERHALPDSFDDNAVEERFRATPEFAAAVQRETSLFLRAAAAADDGEAGALAYEAREAMRTRQARWMTGADAWLVEAEDLWLTFEGAGQWVAYRWLVHADGAAQAPTDVLPGFQRGPWSQTEGFAVVLALDRLVGTEAWRRHAFGDGAKTVLEMLDEALEGG